MREKEIVIEVRNLETDNCASIMLHDFKEQFSNYDGVCVLAEKKLQRAGEKCDLTCLVNFAVSVGAGIISGAIIELIKGVYAHHSHPRGYTWKLCVKSDRSLKVTVYEEDGVISVDIQDEDQKGN